MERKTTQRIIGILVVVALVVILLPLLFNSNSSQPAQTTEVKAPPFPDQATPTQSSAANTPTLPTPTETTNSTPPSMNTTPSTDNPTSSISMTAPTENNTAITNTGVLAPPATPSPSAAAAPIPTPDATTVATSPAKTSDATTISPSPESLNVPTLAANTETPTATPDPKADVKPVANTSIAEESSKPIHTHHSTTKIHSQKHLSQKHQELSHLKNAAWVVQMGCFKNKTNAIRLTNRLRAQGYKAFTREIKSSMRVYVGPEIKQASAASLAIKIEQKLNMHGIVVSYNPLEL